LLGISVHEAPVAQKVNKSELACLFQTELIAFAV